MIKNILLCIILCTLFSCNTFLQQTVKTTDAITDNNTISDPILTAEPETTIEVPKTNNPVETETPTSEAFFDQALDLCQIAQELWQKGELDNALLNLDQAYALIIKVDTLSSPKLIQQKEDLRFMISKRILEIYASRNIVVNGTHNAIPVTINKKVQKEINLFIGRERRFFEQSLARSGGYRPMMQQALKNAGLPEELSWLPLVESGFKLNALSKARALGLWQFIPSTGYMYGLKRNQFIDERLDPVKATGAAINYLKRLHQLFGDWSTVLAAYNCGEGRILRIIRTQNVNYLDNFWDLYEKLPSETARYVPRFLATLHIIQNLEKYGFDKTILNKPPEFEFVKINKQVRLRDIARLINITEKDLSRLNPELRYKIVPGDDYQLRVPKASSAKVIADISKLKIAAPPQRAYVYHRVRSGEALSTIARKYRTSTKAIARANGISKRNFIVAGKLLKIPRRGYTASYAKSASSKRVKKDLVSSSHTVRRGDSLWIIARKYDTTVSKIKSVNNLNGTNLRVGQRLKLPARLKKALASNNNESGTYYVKRGDSPFTIARRHNIPLAQLLKLNRLSAQSTIYPGQKLYVK